MTLGAAVVQPARLIRPVPPPVFTATVVAVNEIAFPPTLHAQVVTFRNGAAVPPAELAATDARRVFLGDIARVPVFPVKIPLFFGAMRAGQLRLALDRAPSRKSSVRINAVCPSASMACTGAPSDLLLLVELPGIEPDALPGLCHLNCGFIPSRSASFPLVTCGNRLGS